MNHYLWKLFGAAMILLLAARHGYSQPGYRDMPSIESMVLNSDVVVVGQIVEVEREKDAFKVTIAVDETLRGAHEDRKVANCKPTREYAAEYVRDSLRVLKADNRRLLVAMQGEPTALQGEPSTVSGIIDLSQKKLRVYAADLRILHRPADVLRVAKEALRRAPGVRRIETFEFELPMDGVPLGFGFDSVSVPVDAQLEKRAIDDIRSNDLDRRMAGMDALAHFKSDDNIELMKTLLSDPDGIVSVAAEDNAGVEVRFLTIRGRAYDNLTTWGVKASKPAEKAGDREAG